jgi:hypothetical protein
MEFHVSLAPMLTQTYNPFVLPAQVLISITECIASPQLMYRSITFQVLHAQQEVQCKKILAIQLVLDVFAP